MFFIDPRQQLPDGDFRLWLTDTQPSETVAFATKPINNDSQDSESSSQAEVVASVPVIEQQNSRWRIPATIDAWSQIPGVARAKGIPVA